MSAEVTTYTELISGVEAERINMGLRQLDFDHLAGFAAGSWGKAAGMLGVRQLRLEYMFAAIRAAGLRLKLEIDPDQQAKMKARIEQNYNPRQANQARNGNHASAISTQVLSRAFGHVLREARKKRWAGKSQAERSEHARTIANARWKKVRKRRKAAELGQKRKREREREENSASASRPANSR